MAEKTSSEIAQELLHYSADLDRLRKHGVPLLKENLQLLLQKVPEIEKIQWYQWYNDYEDSGPIGFKVEDFKIQFFGMRPIEIDDIDIRQFIEIKERHGEDVVHAIKAAQTVLFALDDDLLRETFGDRAYVKVTKNGIRAEDEENDETR